MSHKTTNEIRETFLNFFKKNNHKILHSSPLVPFNDPSLLFTNSGMVQFKNIFTGIESLPEFKRVVTSQKCVRAGGKHNDLDNVGYTSRHHTFFEMLGNFSFGDYFKEEAIEMAWSLITKNFSLDPKKLFITVYHTDEVSYKIWKKITGFEDKKIIKISSSDNFWSMGDIGPCGPCSEIFYDHGSSVKGGLPGSDDEGDRYVEIWNLVFMQYEQKKDGSKVSLPKLCIDTGMGLERLATILQGKKDNYDIDIFRNLIEFTKNILKLKEEDHLKNYYRIIADHIRSSAFLIADGVMPSNDGRGYVLRRIMRRAMRSIHALGLKEPSMYKIIPQLLKDMGKAYPELITAKNTIHNVMFQEENRFQETLHIGLKLLQEETNKLGDKEKLSGEVAFRLYDTYGFPIDLTADALRMQNRSIDIQGFNIEMSKQKAKARASWKGGNISVDDSVWHKIYEVNGKTFYTDNNLEGIKVKVLSIIQDGKEVKMVSEKNITISIVLDATPFYAESGGQIGDIGDLKGLEGSFRIYDTQKKINKIHEHIGKLTFGILRVGDTLDAKIDIKYRKAITIHHSATHILHKTLQIVLGNHISQKGSMVTNEKLRFDISHAEPIPNKTLINIENLVNQIILDNSEVKETIMNIEDAKSMNAMALFGEKYEENVRVIEMGFDNEFTEKKPYSVELCGGSHVKSTGDIGVFKILSESGLAAGIRRIEAVAGFEAIKLFQKKEDDINKISLLMKTNSDLLVSKIQKLINDKKGLENELKQFKLSVSSSEKNDFIRKDFGDLKVYSLINTNIEPRELKSLVDKIKEQKQSGIIIIFSTIENKVSIIIGITKDLIDNYDAVKLVKVAVEILGGNGGGGRRDMAQGGGIYPKKIKDALNALYNNINND